MPKSQSNNRSTPKSVPVIDERLLSGWPVPGADEGGYNEDRGIVLVVGGAVAMPGALILSSTAVLRAGAGKLRIGAGKSTATAIAVAIPEAYVVALPETKQGGIASTSATHIARDLPKLTVLLVGPGMIDPPAVEELVLQLVEQAEDCTIVLDAEALKIVATRPDALHRLNGNVILTPHAGEMASMLQVDKAEITAAPFEFATEAASRLRAVVALKGQTTYVVAPDGEAYSYTSQTIGLATPGSGDTLAGVIAGIAARGATPVQAAAWGVYLHAGAGERLARRMGRLGFLARELLDEIPYVMAKLDHQE